MVVQGYSLLERVRISVMSNVADALSTIVVPAWLKSKTRISMIIQITELIPINALSASSLTVDFEGHPIPASKSISSPYFWMSRNGNRYEIVKLLFLLTYGILTQIAIQIVC